MNSNDRFAYGGHPDTTLRRPAENSLRAWLGRPAAARRREAAAEAWKRLAVYPSANAYILAGGINRWLAVYKNGETNAPGPDHAALGDDTLRHRFAQSLGSRHPESRSDRQHAPHREFQARVKVRKPIRSEGGGCG